MSDLTAPNHPAAANSANTLVLQIRDHWGRGRWSGPFGRMIRDLRALAFIGALGALLISAGLIGSQVRIAKITIEERTGPRTTFRLCLPGKQPDVFGMTDRDFMCHMYDWYGFRHLGGFGKATE